MYVGDVTTSAALHTLAFELIENAMEAWFNAAGTYVGAQAQLPPSFGVTLVRADQFSYCLQAGTGTNVQHTNGPNENAPIAGPC